MQAAKEDSSADSTIWLIGFATASLVFGLLARFGWQAVKRGKQALKVPYVPPVTADTLPNEEILLRGSDASAQEQNQVLLRGTLNGEAADGLELLRSSQGQAVKSGRSQFW